MAIHEFSYDYWNNLLYGIPYGLYLYIIPKSKFNTDDVSVLGNCSAIQSVQYVPFIDVDRAHIEAMPYDTARFGKPNTVRPQLGTVPKVYRLREYADYSVNIGSFPTYNTTGVSTTGKRNWRNESRLYNYPYSFGILTDYLNAPMTIKYHLCRMVANQDVFVRQSISDRCSYGLYVRDYKNDWLGKTEAMVSSDSHELPSSSSAYSQWVATSKNQSQFAIRQATDESFMRQRHTGQSAQLQLMQAQTQGLMQTISGFATGGILGGLMSGAGALVGNQMARQSTGLAVSQANQMGALQRQGLIGANLAMQKDLRSTPNTMLSMGSDIMYGLKNGRKKVEFIRYMVSEEYGQKLGDYFAMYGYKQNKIMSINRRNRHFYNYIKTIGTNLKSYGVPKEHVEKIKDIYNNGVTIWHIDRGDVIVGDYSKDNYEV